MNWAAGSMRELLAKTVCELVSTDEGKRIRKFEVIAVPAGVVVEAMERAYQAGWDACEDSIPRDERN